MDLSPDDLDAVARTVLSETRSPQGQAAVASVIKNRLESGDYPDTPRGIVMARGAFEPWSLPRASANHPLAHSADSPEYKNAAAIANAVFSEKIGDPTGGATLFYDPAAQSALGRKVPKWAQREPSAQIGEHLFFPPEGKSSTNPAPGSVLAKFGFGADGSPGGAAPPASEAPVPGARRGVDADGVDRGNLFIPDPARPGKYLMVRQGGQDQTIEPGSILRKFGFEYDPGTVAKQPLPASMQPPGEKPATPAEAALATQRGMPAQFASGVPIAGPALNWALAAGSAARPRVGETGSFSERLAQRVEEQRRADALWASQNPATAAAANVVGGAATLPVAAARLPFGLSETLGGRMYGGAVAGGAVNALDAALRGQDPTTAAVIGGAGGFLGPAVGEGVAGTARIAGNAAAPRSGPLAGVNRTGRDMLTNALQGETPASLAAASTRMGPAGFVADVNTGLTDLAGGIADLPGEGKAFLREAYRTRAAETGQRIDAAVTRAMGPPVNVVESEKNLTEARKAAADPLYQQWRDTEVKPTPELTALLPRLEAAGAFAQAKRLSGITGEPINENFATGKFSAYDEYGATSGPETKGSPTTANWDLVKRGLDSRIDQAYAKGDKTEARALIGLKSELIDEIEKTPAGDVWRRARQEFASKSSLIDQIAAGRDTFIGGRAGLTPDEMREELRGLSGPELQARIQGARSAVTDAMGDTLHGDTRMRDRLLATNNQKKLRMLIGDAPADALIAELQSERYLAAQDQNVRGGSQTTPKKERVNALQPAELPKYDPSFTRPLSLIPPGAREALRPSTIIEGARGAQYEAARNALAPILVQPNQFATTFLRAVLDEATRRGVVAKRAAKLGGAASAAAGGAAPYIIRRQIETEAAAAR
jgi:hypothetical protein